MAPKVSNAEVEKPGQQSEKYVMPWDKHYFKDMSKVLGKTQKKENWG